MVKKSFSKGFGFIKQDEGGSDLFFHQNALAKEGWGLSCVTLGHLPWRCCSAVLLMVLLHGALVNEIGVSQLELLKLP